MVRLACKQIEVYVFRRRARATELLTLRRAPTRSLAGVWQPITGGIERGETAVRAAAREVFEETGLRPRRWWALETPTLFYDPAADLLRAVPVFAAEASATDRIDLSDEHDRYAFLSASAASKRYLWDTQRRALAAVRREILSGGALATARDVTHLVPAARTRRNR